MATKTATKVQRPTITDAEYKELLAVRLAAMKGFANGEVDAATKNAARAAVRQARKVRKAEGAILEQAREAAESAKQKRSAAAKKAAATRAAKKGISTNQPEGNGHPQGPEQVTI